MSTNHRNGTPATLPLVRCALYTRKSTEEGLEQAFNSLDAQREAAEAYVASQRHEGWTCLPERYDDGGFTGGHMERPALRRLLADIEAGKVDAVVVYKVDRLSRSLLDFARMMQAFEQHQVSFVSVTQQFNTATSMGRLVLNVLLSFAQFEREIIAERTRDKVAATRRKGKWSGGTPLLGYDVDPRGAKLVVNEDEAVRVRAIFDLYLEHRALLPVVQELERRGWVGKRRVTRSGRERGGKPLTRTSLYRLLTNVVYRGQVRYKDEVHPGEHPALVDAETWQRAQDLLRQNGRLGEAPARSPSGALLQGLLRCAPCGCAMTPTYSARGARRYRYYVCSGAQKRGWQTCPSKSVPAAAIEQLVVEQVRSLGRDPARLQAALAPARAQDEARRAELEAERRGLERDLARWHAEMRQLTGRLGAGGDSGAAVTRLADLHARVGLAERRAARVREQALALCQQEIGAEDVARVLAQLDPAGEKLAPGEQARVVQLLVGQVDYDGAQGKVSITFRPTGIQALADERIGQEEEQRA